MAVGSSNFNNRSIYRDVEAQAFIHTTDPLLQKRIADVICVNVRILMGFTSTAPRSIAPFLNRGPKRCRFGSSR
jgi:phosphatidylserine/phosphatidylglycerophosphate/cardiolipin synthase-like enzyme